MILLNALNLNNKGVSLMATTGIVDSDSSGSGITRRNVSTSCCSTSTSVVDHDVATLTALTDSLAAVQHDMRILAAAQEESSSPSLEVPLMFHAHSMLVSTPITSPEIVVLANTGTNNGIGQQQQNQHIRHSVFVLTKAVETNLGNSYVEEYEESTTRTTAKDSDDDVTMIISSCTSQQRMDDAVMCSASIVYNMALFYHLKHLRERGQQWSTTSTPSNNNNVDVVVNEDLHKAEQLYLLCLQVIEPFSIAHATIGLSSIDEHLRNVYLLLRIGSLNNLGSIAASCSLGLDYDSRRRQEACRCYAGLMELLNVLEDDYRSFTVLNSDFQTNMINETEWSAMTGNCLAILFHIFVDAKTALAA
jgi:hypothetical protein